MIGWTVVDGADGGVARFTTKTMMATTTATAVAAMPVPHMTKDDFASATSDFVASESSRVSTIVSRCSMSPPLGGPPGGTTMGEPGWTIGTISATI